YKMLDNEKAAPIKLENIVNCKRILAQSLNEQRGIDHALIELDRPILNRRPLKFRKAGTVGVGEKIVIIGHPSGLPLKIAGGAEVKFLEANYFVANIDAYGGNSGSPIINLSNGLVEGILARGEEDYITTNRKCKVSKRLKDDSELGEDV